MTLIDVTEVITLSLFCQSTSIKPNDFLKSSNLTQDVLIVTPCIHNGQYLLFKNCALFNQLFPYIYFHTQSIWVESQLLRKETSRMLPNRLSPSEPREHISVRMHIVPNKSIPLELLTFSSGSLSDFFSSILKRRVTNTIGRYFNLQFRYLIFLLDNQKNQ